jgi:hypothetical protein
MVGKGPVFPVVITQGHAVRFKLDQFRIGLFFPDQVQGVEGTRILHGPVFLVDGTEGHIDPILCLVGLTMLSKGLLDLPAELIQNLAGLGNLFGKHDLVQKTDPQEAHKGPGHAVTGAIGCRQDNELVHLLDPEKIPADDIPGFVKDKCFVQQLIEIAFRGHHGALYALGITDAVPDLAVLFADGFIQHSQFLIGLQYLIILFPDLQIVPALLHIGPDHHAR